MTSFYALLVLFATSFPSNNLGEDSVQGFSKMIIPEFLGSGSIKVVTKPQEPH